MDEELKEIFASMAEAMMEMKNSILASTNQTAGTAGGVRAVQMETNNILRNISETLQEQLNFFREREAEREFEADTKQQAATAEKTEKASGPEVDGKAGGLLGKIGIGISAIAQGLALMGRPSVFVGIGAITLFTAAMGTVLALLAKFFAEAIGEMIYQLLFNIGRAIVDLGIMIGENKDVLMDASEVIADFVNRMVDIFADFLVDIIPVLESLMKGITEFFKELLPIVAEFLENFAEILLEGLVDIIEALEPIIRDLLNAFNRGFESLERILSVVVSNLSGVISDIADTIQMLITNVVPILREFGNLIDTVGGNIMGIIRTVGSEVSGLVETTFGGLQDTVSRFGNSIEGVVDSVLGGIQGVINQIGDSITQVIDSVTQSIVTLSEIEEEDLAGAARGLARLSGALAAFGGGQALAGIGSLIGGIGGGGGLLGELERFSQLADPLYSASDAIEHLQEVISGFDAEAGSLAGLQEFANTLFESSEKIGDSLDVILGGGGIFGNRAGSPDERTELLNTLSSLTGGTVAGRPQPRGAEVEAETGRLAAAVREAGRESPNISNVRSDSIQDSFNTNQVYITNPGSVEATLDRIFSEER